MLDSRGEGEGAYGGGQQRVSGGYGNDRGGSSGSQQSGGQQSGGNEFVRDMDDEIPF